MSIKEALSAKIATEEDWLNHKRSWSVRDVPLYTKLTGGSAICPWWVEREKERITRGVYESTHVTEFLNTLGQFCLHVSSLDKALVAFTPDARSGEADRQQQISLGRFIVRYFPFYKDEYVQELVAEHLADMSTELELLTGAEAIKNAYLTGPSSCMSKQFPHLSHHPVEAYDAPGISLAVMRDKDGNINARSLVFDGPGGRSYVRVYGDAKLLKRLERLGIQRRTMVGAKFKVIPLRQEEDNNEFIFPYLDSGGTDPNVVRIDNELVQVSAKTLLAVRSIKYNAGVSGTSASGVLRLENISSADFMQQDYITGEVFSTLLHKAEQIYHLGKIRFVQKCNVPPAAKVARVFVNESTFKVLCLDETFEHRERSYRSLEHYIDTQEMRQRLGFVKLSELYYPGEQGWVERENVITTGEGYLKTSDVVHHVSGNADFVVMHHSRVQKGWTQVHSADSKIKAYVSDKTCIRRTKSNRKVVPGYSGVVELWDGNYEFLRNTESVTIFNNTFYYLKGKRPDTEPGSDLWRRALTLRANSYSSVERGVVGALANLGYDDRVRVDDQMIYMSGTKSAQLIRKALHILQKQLRERYPEAKDHLEVFRWYNLHMAETSPESYDNQGNVTTTKIEVPTELAELTQTIINEHAQTKASNDQPETDLTPATSYNLPGGTLNPVTIRATV